MNDFFKKKAIIQFYSKDLERLGVEEKGVEEEDKMPSRLLRKRVAKKSQIKILLICNKRMISQDKKDKHRINRPAVDNCFPLL